MMLNATQDGTMSIDENVLINDVEGWRCPGRSFRRCPLPLGESKVTVPVLMSMEPCQEYILQGVESKEKDGLPREHRMMSRPIQCSDERTIGEMMDVVDSKDP